MAPAGRLLRVLALTLVLVSTTPLVGAGGHVPLQIYEVVSDLHGHGFGEAVAWHGDSLVVGSPDEDRVQVMELRDGLWRTAQVLVGEANSAFGYSLAVDGDLLVVGAPNENVEDGDGAAHVYRYAGSTWLPLSRLTPSGSYNFGETVDVDGDWVVVGAPSPIVISSSGADSDGTVTLYKVGTEVRHQQTLRLNPLLDRRSFGHALDLHGDRLLVGAPGWLTEDALEPGKAYVYVRSGNTWSEEQVIERGPLQDADGFGSAVALWDDEAVVCDDAGLYVDEDADRAVFVYRRSGSRWTVGQTIRDVSCVEVARNAGTLATAGYERPYLRVYGREGGTWVQEEFEDAPRPTAMAVGEAVAIGYPSTYGGVVALLGHNAAPRAFVAEAEPPVDLDGDGVETVTLDGSESHGGDGDAVEHFWYLEDELLGTGPVLTVDLPVGIHPVRLAVSDPMLGTDVQRADVLVQPPPPPKADFSWLPAQATVEETFRFVDESTSEYGHVVSWSWDFDGDRREDARGPTPSWDFTESGRHPVTLTVRTDLDAEASVTKRVTVRNLAPVADAGMDQIIHDQNGDGVELVRLDGGDSDDRDGRVRSYRWEEDGDRFSTSESPTVLLRLGVHDVDLTVEDDQGAKDTDRVTILILQDQAGSASGSGGNGTTGGGSGTPTGITPKAAFNWKPDPGPPAHAVKFTDQSGDADGRVVMWWYDVGDDDTYEATEPDPVLSMDGYGARDVRLKVTDDDGQQSEVVRNVFLKNEAPEAVIGARATEAYVGQKVVLVDNSTDPENALAERRWDFGDGGSSTEQAPVHAYAAAGTYTVKLTVTDDGGKSDDATLTVTVREVPAGVTIPAVAGSPVVQQAKDSPFAEEEPLVDTDGDGAPDAPAGGSRDTPSGGDADDDADGFQATGEEKGPNPVAALADPGKPWLWIGVLVVAALLGAILFAVARR